MNKPWVGYLASSLLLISGVLEIIAEKTMLGIFLIIMAVVTFFVRNHFIKKLRDGNKDH